MLGGMIKKHGTLTLLAIFVAAIEVVLVLSGNVYASSCGEAGLYCSIPGGTRRINGLDVTRECWQYKYRLDCKNLSKADCGKIDHEACSMVAEDCISNEEEGGLKYCANLKRSFACEREISWDEERVELVSQGESKDGKDLLCASLCLDGNCDAVKKAEMEKDSDLGNAVAMLSALKDAKNGIVGDALINIFKGMAEHCDKKLWGYTNCCTKLGGWGSMLGAGCSEEAKNLAKKRKEKKCVEVGTYCKTKVPIFGCVIKRTVFCCYDSIIAKILNQEAKRQLRRGNGDAENPSCGGLSVEDFDNIDFSTLDFSEFYNEVVVPNLNLPEIKIDVMSNSKTAKDIRDSVVRTPAERKGFSENIEQQENVISQRD